MQMYLQSHYVGERSLAKVDALLTEFKDYISRFPDVIKLTVCLSGSFATGMGSRGESSLDLIICMDGGQLTSSLDGDQLALALSTGLNDWERLRKLTPVGNGTSLLIIEPKDEDLTLRIRTCKPSTFPINNLYHTQLFSSYSLCDPRVPVMVALVKQWARCSGYSRETPNGKCLFSGFHWTIIALAFLVDVKLVPHLHLLALTHSDAPREVFGPHPDKDAFVLISDAATARRLVDSTQNRNQPIEQLIAQFFSWLGSVDLLSTMVHLKGERVLVPSISKGWVVIADPVQSGNCNTVDENTDQKNHVLFAMKLQRSALSAAASLSQVSDEAGVPSVLAARSSVGGSVVKVDAAVP